jgi:hypothetical protein
VLTALGFGIGGDAWRSLGLLVFAVTLFVGSRSCRRAPGCRRRASQYRVFGVVAKLERERSPKDDNRKMESTTRTNELNRRHTTA